MIDKITYGILKITIVPRETLGKDEIMNFILKKLSYFKQKRFLYDILIIFVIMIGLHFWQTKELLPTGHQVIPDFTLNNLDNQEITIASHKQSIKLLYFFAPWCSVCKFVTGNVNFIHSFFSKEQLEVYAIALSYDEKQEIVDYAKDKDFKVEVLLGNERAHNMFQVNAFPTFYFLDQKGKVAARSVGYTSTFGLLIRSWYVLLWGG